MRRRADSVPCAAIAVGNGCRFRASITALSHKPTILLQQSLRTRPRTRTSMVAPFIEPRGLSHPLRCTLIRCTLTENRTRFFVAVTCCLSQGICGCIFGAPGFARIARQKWQRPRCQRRGINVPRVEPKSRPSRVRDARQSLIAQSSLPLRGWCCRGRRQGRGRAPCGP